MNKWAKFSTKAKKLGMKAKAKGASFYKKNKAATIAAGAGAGAVGSYQVGSARAEKKTTKRATVAVGSAYMLGKRSKVKGAFQINIAPKFRAVAEQPSRSGKNLLVINKSNKEFLKSIKGKKFQAVTNKKRKK